MFLAEVVTFSGCGVFSCGPGANNDIDVRQCVEGEEVLTFTHEKAYGFCPRQTDLFSAVVVEGPDGAPTFCGTELVEAWDGCPNCVANDYTESCLVEWPMPRKTLTAAQTERLREILAAVPGRVCSDEPIATDWCIIRVYEFLGRREQAVCTFGYVNADFRAAIEDIDAFLQELPGP
jgi:hypothetical protein